MNLRIAFVFVGLLVISTLAAPPARGISGLMPCMSKNCDMNSGPVCAVDDSGVPMTFENRCLAELAYCRFGIYYAVVRHGEC